MTFLDMLGSAERQNNSIRCFDLNTELARFPGRLKSDGSGIYDFCAAIVNSVAGLVSAFKPQIDYVAGHRTRGQPERLMAHVRRVARQVPVILDVKRGDISRTFWQYAIEVFEHYGADAITPSPFMRFDSVAHFLKHWGKGAFLLRRTFNSGGEDLQSQCLVSVDR